MKHNRTRQPYAWLGAGAITLGIGAAMAAGSAVASADTGQAGAAGTKSNSSTSASTGKAGAGHQRPRTASPASTRTPVPPAATPTQRSKGVAAAKPATAKAGAAAAEATDPEPEEEPYGGKSYLPDNEVIVPGSAVKLALQQIAQTQSVLQAKTWGTGNAVAGVASVVPQMFLAEAAWALNTWQNSMDGVKAAVANTTGVPVVHQLAQLSLLATMMLPNMAGVALDAARLTVPLVGGLGSPTAAAQATGLIDQAKTNGMVYSVHLLRTAGNAEIVYISVNGGPVVPIQLDTGSSGLTILRKYVGQNNLGPSTGAGESGYGDADASVYYNYHTYLTTIDFGGGAITAPGNIRIVDADSENAFDNYGTAPQGTAGTLGIGANTGAGPTLTALLPGETRDGMLMYEKIIGPWGLVVFGPNPLPSKGSVVGAPIADVQVQINDQPKSTVRINVDSGGETGNLPSSVAGAAQDGTKLKPGTKVSVYTADGQTLLYTYVVNGNNSPAIYPDSETGTRPNTGRIPWNLGPMYIDYGTPDRLGATHFDYF
ncbi:PecA family PE domain-processing aspartic protease [Mycolicibacterium sp. Dal123E01]|uniref:PecA family PE domain-processing aspartic protease n=1 Tax=Mycolicibacterium sp. Dal123E01 TaxID=3457578 RepID=UPI00403EEE1F